MKHVNVKNWMMTLLLAGACCGFVACDDNDDAKTPPTGPDASTVVGTYEGTMNILDVVAPQAEGDEATGTPLAAIVTANEIQMNDFPIRNLVARIVGEEAADGIVAMIGKVNYAIPYTAVVSEDKATINMPLEPAPLKLTLTAPAEEEGEPQSLEIEVTITAEADGVYTVESGKMGFTLGAAGVSLNGTPLEGFEGFSLEFDMQQGE